MTLRGVAGGGLLPCVLVLALAACGGSGGAKKASGPSPPAGKPVPAGFRPVSFTAISARDYWLLGAAPCAAGACPSIVRTTDGGKRFVAVPAQPVRVASGTPAAAAVDTLRFADRLDGYAFDSEGSRSAAGAAAALWVTHDGGGHWTRAPLAHVRAFGTGAGYAFAVTGTCSGGRCGSLELRRSRVGSDSWTAQALPVGPVDPIVALAVHGRSLWLSLTATSGTAEHQTLLVSADAGRTFSRGRSPCYSGLGGTLAASSPSVVWAVCPTGMLASAYRSADRGTTWTPLHPGRELDNSATIAPADDTTAVLATADQSQLLRTVDAGASFTTVFPASSGFWSFVGFTDPRTGTGIRLPGGATGGGGLPPNAQLFRSGDGGGRWSGPVAIH